MPAALPPEEEEEEERENKGGGERERWPAPYRRAQLRSCVAAEYGGGTCHVCVAVCTQHATRRTNEERGTNEGERGGVQGVHKAFRKCEAVGVLPVDVALFVVVLAESDLGGHVVLGAGESHEAHVLLGLPPRESKIACHPPARPPISAPPSIRRTHAWSRTHSLIGATHRS